MKTIIIGGVAVGATAAMKLRRNSPENQVILYEKGSVVSFSNCGLPYGIFNDEISSKLAPKDTSKLTKAGIEAFVNHEVIEINEKEKKVVVRNLINGEIFEDNYDKLILAMGAKSLNLPIEGLKNEENVYSLRTYDDLKLINKKINNRMRNALIIGAGFIGVEVAETLVKNGLNVTIVEMSNNTTGFDIDFSSLVDDTLRNNGIDLIKGDSLSNVDSKRKIATTNSGIEIKYDFIITSGIKPNIDILYGTSLELEHNRFIKTNKYMQTSNNDIYAGGDLTLTPHLITGEKSYQPYALNAKNNGRLIADHISGLKTKGQFRSSGASIYKVFGVPYGKAGITENEAKKYNISHRIIMPTVNSSASYLNGTKKLIFKLIFGSEDKKLLGIQAQGEHADRLIDSFAVAIYSNLKIEDLEEMNFSYQPHFSTTLSPLNIAAQIAKKEDEEGFISVCPFNIPKEEVIVIDVRSPEQHEKGNVRGSINIPFNDFSEKTLPQNKKANIYVHCNSGFTSTLAAAKLKKMGYKNVFNVYGGNNLYQSMYRNLKPKKR
ncbi:MAG: FAD-dependent oxidoreductase [Mycoplasmatales bacterium]|nr:FAD-dependent oxidoreductase [Mycoplasmatales bacterium]